MIFRGDICLCTNSECTQKEKCYRYNAVPCELQPYAQFQQVDGKCDYFIDMHEDTDE